MAFVTGKADQGQQGGGWRNRRAINSIPRPVTGYLDQYSNPLYEDDGNVVTS
ncbi:MAG: hypothetical protein KF778_21425 [Rhodocyclaceae bacterium]|nr:hypothetical protein [Rhodocyclaceae bacterium]